MLKKRQRLTKQQFDHFFKTGRRYHHPLLQLVYTPGQDFHGAAVVGKKIYKRAVDRNRYRRRLYAALYRQKQQADLRGVYILLLKPAAKDVAYGELAAAVSDLVGRVGKSR